MSRKELTALIITVSAILLTAGATMLPNSFKEQFPWIWQVLVGAGVLLMLIALALLIKDKLWKVIGSFFLVRIFRELTLQSTKPSQFVFVQKSQFAFLPMSGGENSRIWSCELHVVSCLFRDMKVDRLDVVLSWPIQERWQINGEFCLKHFGSTKINSGNASMSDTSFHYLEKQSKQLRQKEAITLNCCIVGFYRNKKLFEIAEDNYIGKLNEWGQNNAKT